MIEKNSDTFLAGADALVYLAEPIHKKYSTKLFWGNPFSTYVSYDQFFMDGVFLNQKINNNIRVSYSLKYKHWKKNKFFNSHTCPKILPLISVT